MAEAPNEAQTPVRPGRHRAAARRRHSAIPLLILVGAFAISRIITALVGVRFDSSPIDGTPSTDTWQLLDVRLLHHHLIDSVWHLNSQPPLFNLYSGVLLKLPDALRSPVEVITSLALGLAIVLFTYLLMVELRVPRLAALIVTLIGVVASPAYLLFENWLDYAYPTAALGIVAAWCLIRYLRTERAGYGVGFFAAYSAVVLLNSTYQIEWLLVALVIVLIVLRRRWRQVLAVAAVPVLLVVGWYVKDAVMFGTTTTSSWLGMNMARNVLFKVPLSERAALERDGTMTSLASVVPFGPANVYVPKFVRPHPNPVPAVGALYKADGAPNLNNPIYIALSSEYLRDDLAFIRTHPGAYLADINSSVQVWLVPTDQNFTSSVNWPHLRSYAAIYDRAVEWQPTTDPAAALALFSKTPSPLSWLSIQAIIVYSLALIGGPVVAWRRRRLDPALAGTIAVLWWTTLYALVASSLIELGENERFRFGLGPIPLVLAVVVVTTVIRALSGRGWSEPTPSVPVTRPTEPTPELVST